MIKGKHHIPSMEKQHMDSSGRKCSKAYTICHSEKCAEVKRPLFLISCDIKVKVAGDYGGDIVLLACGCEEIIGEDGEGFGFVDIEPIADGSQNIHDKDEANSHIGCGEPRACKGASKVGGNGGPVKPHCSNSKPVKA